MMFQAPDKWTGVPKKRTPYGTGEESMKAAEHRAKISEEAKALLEKCRRASSRDRSLVCMDNLNKLRELVEARTQVKCERYQYREQAALVEYLMQWFHTREKLLEAVQLAIDRSELPPGFGPASPPDPFADNFDPWDDPEWPFDDINPY